MDLWLRDFFARPMFYYYAKKKKTWVRVNANVLGGRSGGLVLHGCQFQVESVLATI